MSGKIVQQTLEGLSVSALPRVRTTDGHLLDWDRETIAKQLLKETKLSEQFYKVPGITEEEAKEVAREVERRVRWMNVKYLSGPLVREIMNVILLERHHPEWRNICTRVGTPVFDAHLIDIGNGFEARENANLQENAETSHKKKADKISKEQYLLLLPPYLADHHLAGDLHIHDLEYFGTRPFCLDGKTEIYIRGTFQTSVALQSVEGTTSAIQLQISEEAIQLDQLPFGNRDEISFAPNTMLVQTPKGYRQVLKATRRYVKPNELLAITTKSKKQLLATKDHRIPVKTSRGMEIRKAGELSVRDVLYNASDFDNEELRNLPGGDDTICQIEPADPSGRYVYDLFIEGDGSEESHTFFTKEGLLVHNCQDWDLRYFFYYGLMPDGLGTKASVAGPAKKPEVAILHAVKALGSAQTNFAGGQGFYNFLTFISPYFEGLHYDEIKQLMQMFVYEMTQMMVARGGQLVFSSVQLTPGVPTLWKDKPAVYSGKVWDGEKAPLKKYGDFEREVRLAFKALMEVMLAGDHWGKPFNFPKPEISIEPDFMHEDEEFNQAHPDLPTYQDLYLLTFKLAAEYGTPYFDNQLPEYRGAGKGISCYQCCAYQFAATYDSDSQFDDKLHFRDGKHFSMGSWQVVSLNCPRAAYLARGDDDLLFEYLRGLMDISVEVFKVKREWMNQIIKNHRMPFATQQPRDPATNEKGAIAVGLEGLVYTIGVVGVNEMVQFHTGHQMHQSKEAWKLAVRAMTEMEIYSKELSSRHGMTIALARTPAETTAQRFAVSDLIHEEYRECAEGVVKGDLGLAKKSLNKTRDLPIYYTNGTHLPPGAEVSIMERAKIEHVFFPIVDGGNIFHIFMGEASPDPQGLMDFGMRLAKTTQIGYFTFTRDMTVCLSCYKVNPGLKDQCPGCGSEDIEHISRITGYLQAVSGWNGAKRQELKDRKRYDDLA